MDQPYLDRYLSRVDRSGGPDACWPWLGGHDGGGYGMASVARYEKRRTHRIALDLVGREVPSGATIDHLCRNRGCANPAHLEVVSRGENVRRGGPYRRKEFCNRGHRLAETRTRSGCRACHNEDSLAKYHATKVLKGPREACRRGHPLSGSNLRILKSGERLCVTCARARSLRWWRKQA